MTETPTVEQLLPCPFCGGEGEMSFYARMSSPDAAGFFVECIDCSASGQGFDIQGDAPDRDAYTKAKAVTAWNTRTQQPRPDASVDGLAGARAIWDAAEDAYDAEMASPGSSGLSPEDCAATVILAALTTRGYTSVDGLAGELREAMEHCRHQEAHEADMAGCLSDLGELVLNNGHSILAALTTREAVVEDDATVERVARAIAPMICRPVHNGDCDDVAAGQAFARRVAAAAIRALAAKDVAS